MFGKAKHKKKSDSAKYFSFMTTKPEIVKLTYATCTILKEKHFVTFVSLLRPLKYRGRCFCHSLLH